MRLVGHKSPTGATGSHPSYVGSVITDLSVKAPTVIAFHAWAGFSIGSISLRAGYPAFERPSRILPAEMRIRRLSVVLAKAELIDGRGP